MIGLWQFTSGYLSTGEAEKQAPLSSGGQVPQQSHHATKIWKLSGEIVVFSLHWKPKLDSKGSGGLYHTPQQHTNYWWISETGGRNRRHKRDRSLIFNNQMCVCQHTHSKRQPWKTEGQAEGGWRDEMVVTLYRVYGEELGKRQFCSLVGIWRSAISPF